MSGHESQPPQQHTAPQTQTITTVTTVNTQQGCWHNDCFHCICCCCTGGLWGICWLCSCFTRGISPSTAITSVQQSRSNYV